MRAKIRGYEIDCTPEEFRQLVGEEKETKVEHHEFENKGFFQAPFKEEPITDTSTRRLRKGTLEYQLENRIADIRKIISVAGPEGIAPSNILAKLGIGTGGVYAQRFVKFMADKMHGLMVMAVGSSGKHKKFYKATLIGSPKTNNRMYMIKKPRKKCAYNNFLAESQKKYTNPPYNLSMGEAMKRSGADWQSHKAKRAKSEGIRTYTTLDTENPFETFTSVNKVYYEILENLVKSAIKTSKKLHPDTDGFAIGIETMPKWHDFCYEFLKKSPLIKTYCRIENCKILHRNRCIHFEGI